MSDPCRVVVIGLGGIGSWLADAFGRVLNVHAPESQLVLVDGDVFEAKNAARQNFSSLGNKAEVVARDLTMKLDATLVIAKAAWVVSDDLAQEESADEEGVSYISASQLMQEGDIVFICVDNMKTRKEIFDAVEQYDDIHVFNGGNEDTGFGSTYYYCRENGENVMDPPGVHHDEFVHPPDKNPGELSCADRAKLESGTQLVATNLTVAAVMCHDAQQSLFADQAGGEKNDGYHRAGVLLTHEKMWDVDVASMVSYARMPQEQIDELCALNSEVAETVHNKVLTLTP